jgi:hypothetical protein
MKFEKFFIYLLLVLCFIASFMFTRNSRPELYDDSLKFQNQFVINDTVKIKILDSKSYNNGKTGVDYYIFTDKGRLLINNKDSFFNSDLQEKAFLNINKVCTAKVKESIIISDWQVTSFTC